MNKKITLVITVLVVIILAVAIILGINRKTTNTGLPADNNENKNNQVDIGDEFVSKLQQYLEILGNNYYIKYSGKFKNNSGEKISAIVEYTKSDSDYGLRSSELEMQLIWEGQKLYSISNKYKMIVEMGRDSIDISEYNLVSDIGQIYVKSYIEKIGNIEYDVEEYLFNEKNIRYYFIGNDIKIIRYDGEDIKVIRLEKNTNAELLKKPTDYDYAIV